MYKLVFLEERVAINPSELTKKEVAHDIDSVILEKLKKKIEGRCISSGYVKPDSLEILHRSMGGAENGRFTGNYIYYIKLRCRVFHPETDTPVECKVIKVNKMGAYAVYDEAMRILIPRDLHIGNVDFDKLNPDDTILVQVLRSRFQTNDAYISAVGMFISRAKKGKDTKKPAPVPSTVEEEEDNNNEEEAAEGNNEEEENNNEEEEEEEGNNEEGEEENNNNEEEEEENNNEEQEEGTNENNNEGNGEEEEEEEEEEEPEPTPEPTPPPKTRGRPRRKVAVSAEPEVEGVAVPTPVKTRTTRRTAAVVEPTVAAPAQRGKKTTVAPTQAAAPTGRRGR